MSYNYNMPAESHMQHWDEHGYAILPALFTPEETQVLRDHFMDLRSRGEYPGDFGGVDPQSNDPLKRFPRMIHMHRWDDRSLRWMIDKRIDDAITAFTGESPFAVQTMLYFKPAGGRGQALHQDQFYLRAKPGTCVAAWMALDRCDIENGCMQVVPGSHRLPLLCTTMADTTQSFTDVTVPLPDDLNPVPVIMEAGDVMFFHGQLIHGSFPNTSKDRFRRALIGHYITGDARQVAQYYHPVLRMDGSEVELDKSPDGGPCGVWIDRNGKSEVEMRNVAQATGLHE